MWNQWLLKISRRNKLMMRKNKLGISGVYTATVYAFIFFGEVVFI